MGGPTGGLLLPLACPPSTHTPIIQYQYTCSANIASDGPGLGPALLSRILQTNTQIKKCCPQNANVAWESLWYFLLSAIYKPFSTLVLEVPIQWPQLLCCTQLLYRKKKVSFTNTHSSKEAAEAVEREIISLRIGGRQWVALSAQLWTISSAAPGSVLSRILRLPWWRQCDQFDAEGDLQVSESHGGWWCHPPGLQEGLRSKRKMMNSVLLCGIWEAQCHLGPPGRWVYRPAPLKERPGLEKWVQEP